MDMDNEVVKAPFIALCNENLKESLFCTPILFIIACDI